MSHTIYTTKFEQTIIHQHVHLRWESQSHAPAHVLMRLYPIDKSLVCLQEGRHVRINNNYSLTILLLLLPHMIKLKQTTVKPALVTTSIKLQSKLVLCDLTFNFLSHCIINPYSATPCLMRPHFNVPLEDHIRLIRL